MSTPTLPPLGLYVHIPWCERKCPYCDFNSHAAGGEIPELAYIDCLLLDLEQDLHYVQARQLESIFIGGGTPSLFSVRSIDRLLAGIRDRVTLAEDCEITMEANPGSAEADKFAGYVNAGVTRISVGVQSFCSDSLTALGRVHDSEQARRAVAVALASGAASVNVDLMHGLPGQDSRSALADLAEAIALGPAHLSWYQLTIEQNTAFYKRPPVLPGEDTLSAIQQEGEALLAERGYENYEVSAYSQPGQRCRHNLNYWHFGDYLGIGAGAHGKVTLPAERRVRRTVKRRQPGEYLAGAPHFHTQGHDIAAEDLCGDFMLNALRLSEGFDPALFSARTGLDSDRYAVTAGKLAERGLLELSPGRVRPTSLGRRFLDDVVAAFL
jgi:oxygen-independent coproporphyrinogen-3 oxidase